MALSMTVRLMQVPNSLPSHLFFRLQLANACSDPRADSIEAATIHANYESEGVHAKAKVYNPNTMGRPSVHRYDAIPERYRCPAVHFLLCRFIASTREKTCLHHLHVRRLSDTDWPGFGCLCRTWRCIWRSCTIVSQDMHLRSFVPHPPAVAIVFFLAR